MINIISSDIVQMPSGSIRQVFKISIDNHAHDLWYELDPDYECALCDHRCDGVVITLLPYALMFNQDIRSNLQISKRLHFQLTTQIIPQLAKWGGFDSREITLDIPTSKEIFNAQANVTGVSCGIDSSSAIWEYTDACDDPEYKITQLLYFKVGAHDGQIGRADEQVENELYNGQHKNAQQFCDRYGYELISMDSNVNVFLADMFGFVDFEPVETFRNAGAVLMLQKFIKRWYYASTYTMDSFTLSLKTGSSHYSKWLLPNLETETTYLCEVNGALDRIEKTAETIQFKPSYDSLLVCRTDTRNCGHCMKCIHTLAALDLLGAVERYEKSFDLNDWQTNRDYYFAKIIDTKDNDVYSKEIYQYMIDHNLPMPSRSAFNKVARERNERRLRQMKELGPIGFAKKAVRKFNDNR